MKIEFCDLKRQYTSLKEQIDSRIKKVLEHCRFVNGPEIEEIENKFSDFLSIKNSIAVSSGTDALLLSLLALDIKKGDYVITTPFTFFATAETIALTGARPLFVDIDEKTYNIDSRKLKEFLLSPVDPVTKEDISGKIKAVIPIDLFGQAADYDRIAGELNKEIPIIEDAAQSFGAEYKQKKAGSLGDISITSFFPSKPLGCYGDGGMIFLNNDALAGKIRLLRNHGQDKKYSHKILGFNARLDTVQAAILLAKFDFFISREIQKREETAKKYCYLLKENEEIALPYIEPFNKSVFAQFSIQTSYRDELKNFLEQSNIPTAIHYPKPLHLQEAFKYLGYKEGDFPVSENVSRNILSLPFDAWKTDEEIEYICSRINSFHKI